jgi:hypothetical protein
VSGLFPTRISEDERVRRAQVFFETHRLRQLQTWYPEETLIDVSRSELIDCWSNASKLLKDLYNLLPFGEALLPSQFEELVDQDLPKISRVAQEQLLYWHLSSATTIANHPVENILLWNKDDYFWFYHIPPREIELIAQILNGRRIRYLERFRLDYTEIQLTFQEIRLASHANGHRLAITEGREYTYKWANNTWENTLENPDQRLVDPRILHLPPDAPSDPAIIDFANTRRFFEEEQLPPSSPPSPTTSDSLATGWGVTSDQWNRTTSCWCSGKEICDCGYRPDTPPTPPSVVLWAPGQAYLPSH